MEPLSFPIEKLATFAGMLHIPKVIRYFRRGPFTQWRTSDVGCWGPLSQYNLEV